MWSAETLVDASFSNRVSDWIERILKVEILMRIGDGMNTICKRPNQWDGKY